KGDAEGSDGPGTNVGCGPCEQCEKRECDEEPGNDHWRCCGLASPSPPVERVDSVRVVKAADPLVRTPGENGREAEVVGEWCCRRLAQVGREVVIGACTPEHDGARW